MDDSKMEKGNMELYTTFLYSLTLSLISFLLYGNLSGSALKDQEVLRELITLNTWRLAALTLTSCFLYVTARDLLKFSVHLCPNAYVNKKRKQEV